MKKGNKNLQRRILALYIAFFAAIIASFCFGTLGSGLAKRVSRERPNS